MPSHDLLARLAQRPPESGPEATPEQRARAAAMHVGNAVREALGQRPMPLLAVQTTFSFLRGTVTPDEWGGALAGLCRAREVVKADRRGGNYPASLLAVSVALQAGAFTRATQVPPPAPVYVAEPESGDEGIQPWAALADLGDLAGLPAAIEQWGRRMAVGATLPVHERSGPADLVLCIAPDHAAYRALCRLLSWRNENEKAWHAWLNGETHDAPPLEGLVVLAPAMLWADRFAWHGAEVFGWLTGHQQSALSPQLAPVVAPLLTALSPGHERRQYLQALIQDRSGIRMHVDSARVGRRTLHLTDLPDLLETMRDYDEAIERGRALMRRCTYTPGAPLANGHTPWQLPPPLVEDPDAELRKRCSEGIRQRYGGAESPKVRERLNYELDIFTKKGFSPYVLAVWHLTRFRQTCGRGSAASSLVCYVLGITNVDPLKHKLVFERFLSEERFDPPDIDVDFAHDERDAVLQETIDTFGREHVALVSTHQTLHHQGAWREAGRVLGKERSAITDAQRDLSLQRNFSVGNGPDACWNEVRSAAQDLVGAVRNFGVHCGGIVITRDPIREMVPIHPAAKQLQGLPAPAIAWEKDGAELLGLVKIDFLGNRSLGVVRDVLADLREDGIIIDDWKWQPEEDHLARQLVSRGRTIGCFYIESPAMRLLNAKAGETDFERLTLHSSIIRPAANSWINTYLERFTEFRRTGQQRDEWYPHPALRALLSDSFGVLSYQEDLMLISRDLAGFSIKQQNSLRKALGRSDTPQRLAALAGGFFSGCAERGISPEVGDLVWTMIVSFAGYSFTKAHSASYVKVSFQAACLKVHNPAHFMARVIANGGGFYGPCAYVEEARRWKVEIQPPCVMSGTWDTKRSTHHSFRLGFQLVHGLRRGTVARLLDERERAPFIGAFDFWRRSRASATEMHVLLRSGAFDGLLATHSPAGRFWLIDQAVTQSRGQSDGEPDQLEFDFAADIRSDPVPPRDLTPISQRALDRHAWQALAVLPRAHPFALWDLPAKRRWHCLDVRPDMQRRRLTLLVWVITSKQVLSTQLRGRDGKALDKPSIRPMAFVTLEDEGGIAESVWFPETYQACGASIEAGRPFWATGIVMVEFGVATFQVVGVEQIPD
jgi:DNA polymerase III alpha subunit